MSMSSISILPSARRISAPASLNCKCLVAFLIVLVDDDEEAVAKQVNEQSIVVHNNDSSVHCRRSDIIIYFPSKLSKTRSLFDFLLG